MDQDTPPPPPPPPSDSAPTQEHAVATTLTHVIQLGSTSVPETSLERDSAAPSHGIQRASPSFLGLPGEIRNMVYTWLFPMGRSAVQLLARHRGGYIDMGECLGLLTTCRQVYDEASSLLRTERRFVVVQPNTIIDMLDPYRAGGSHEVSRRIWNYVCPHGVQLRYDIDKRTTEKIGPPLSDICKRLRKLCLLLTYMKVTVSVSYPFHGLEEWAQSVSGYLGAAKSNGQNCITVILLLPQTDSNGKKEFYLPAVRLVRATKDLGARTTLRVVTANTDENKANVEESTDLGSFGQNLLLFIRDLLEMSPDPFNEPIPRIWIHKDYLEVSHAEIEAEDGRVVRVPYELGKSAVEDAADDLVMFFLGYHGSNTGDEDAAAPELARYSADTIYAEDTLINLAQEVARLCMSAYYIEGPRGVRQP